MKKLLLQNCCMTFSHAVICGIKSVRSTSVAFSTMYSYGETKFANVKGYFTDYYQVKGSKHNLWMCPPLRLIVETLCPSTASTQKVPTFARNWGSITHPVIFSLKREGGFENLSKRVRWICVQKLPIFVLCFCDAVLGHSASRIKLNGVPQPQNKSLF